MGKFDALVAIDMGFSVHDFAWVNAYLACGCATSDDAPIFNVSVWKGVGSFFEMEK